MRFNTIFVSFGSGLIFWATLYIVLFPTKFASSNDVEGLTQKLFHSVI